MEKYNLSPVYEIMQSSIERLTLLVEQDKYTPECLTLKYGRGIDRIEKLAGRKCHYCNVKTKLVNSRVIYGKDYGYAYLCKQCGAYVGCHWGTKISKGIVANEDLRKLKRDAHRFFDVLWKRKSVKAGVSENKARRMAYKWLSNQTGITEEFCHIGMMNESECKMVIDLCSPFY